MCVCVCVCVFILNERISSKETLPNNYGDFNSYFQY